MRQMLKEWHLTERIKWIFRKRRPEHALPGEEEALPALPKDGKRRMVKAAAIFLALMLIFTFLSRAAASVTVPRVTVEKPTQKVIERRIQADGKVYQNREQAILVEPNLLVDEIYVNEGQKVEAGELLFTLNQASLDETILTLTQEIEKMKLSARDIQSRQDLTARQKEAARKRAEQDYNTAAATGDRAIDYAAGEANRARQALNDFYNQPDAGTDSGEVSMQASINQMEAQLSGYQNQLESLPEDADEETANELMAQIQTLQDQINQAYQDLSAYQQLRAAEQEKAWAAEEKQLIADLKAKEKAYNDAVAAKEQSLTAANRALEDAKMPEASDGTIESTDMDIQLKQMDLDKLRSLKNQEGKITAPVQGTITKLELVTGGLTGETAAITMADLTSGTKYVAQVAKDQEKYLSPGQTVTLKTSAGKRVEGLTIHGIADSKEDAQMLEVSVLMLGGDLDVGTSAAMTAVQQSEAYPLCVPVQALHMENMQYYVYVLEEQETVLGTEYVARKMDVRVIEKNGQFAALEAVGISEGSLVITDYTGVVEADGKVRLKDA